VIVAVGYPGGSNTVAGTGVVKALEGITCAVASVLLVAVPLSSNSRIGAA
jgi:hypothetical protein